MFHYRRNLVSGKESCHRNLEKDFTTNGTNEDELARIEWLKEKRILLATEVTEDTEKKGKKKIKRHKISSGCELSTENRKLFLSTALSVYLKVVCPLIFPLSSWWYTSLMCSSTSPLSAERCHPSGLKNRLLTCAAWIRDCKSSYGILIRHGQVKTCPCHRSLPGRRRSRLIDDSDAQGNHPPVDSGGYSRRRPRGVAPTGLGIRPTRLWVGGRCRRGKARRCRFWVWPL
jgi:hypothetical protein